MRAIVVGCAASALAVLPSAAQGAVLGQDPGSLQRTVGEAVSQAAELPKRLLPPAAPAPAPAPKPAAPAERESIPSPAAAPRERPAPAKQAGQVRASTSQNSDPGDVATQDRSAPPPARPSGTQPADPTDAAATPRPVLATGADIGAADDEASLPFTGSRTLPLLMVAVLVLLTGIGLRRAVRTG